MLRKFLVIFSSFIAIHTVQAQDRIANFYFENTLSALEVEFPPLVIDGGNGFYKNEVVPNLGRAERRVYVFPDGGGLVFDNSKIKNFIVGSYTIEMYFRYDNGELLLYNKLLGDQLSANQGKYVHLVVSRNHETKEVLFYFNGKMVIKFVDTNDDSAMGSDRQITFFSQEGAPTTSGAVAMIKVYNYFINEKASKKAFESFTTETPSKNLKTTKESKILLEKLFFAQSQSTILAESIPTLDELVDFLQKDEKIRIEIQGHSDNQGDYYKNIALSKSRADEVKKYLIDNGISESRLETRGFGGTRPMVSNYLEENRKLNRRVEIEILK